MGLFSRSEFTKAGPGISKNAPEKKRFFAFTELYFRKISKLIQVNLLFLVACIPALLIMLFFIPSQSLLLWYTLPTCLIGPATAGMTKVVKDLTLERPVFMISDFKDGMKDNFKQSFLYGIIFSAISTLLLFAALTYVGMLNQSIIYYALLGLILAASILFAFMNCYIYLQMVTVNLTFRGLITNSFRFAVLGFKNNVFTCLFCGVLSFLCIWFFPYTLVIMVPIGFSTINMITTFNSYPCIEKYIVEPYYEAHPEQRPGYNPDGEEEESVFSDEQLIPAGDDEEE